MVEPVTLGLGALAAYLGKDGLQKLLGPTADYLGNGLKDFTQKRSETIGKIFANATSKLGEQIDYDGAVPPKFLKQIVEDGSFADDAVEIDYLGGVLASSRSDHPRDNRGASFANQINALSNYQLKAHYLLYSSLRKVYASSGLTMGSVDRPKMLLFMPYREFCEAMDYSKSEFASPHLLRHIFLV